MPIAVANSNDNWISDLTDPTISAEVSGFAATGSLTYSDLVAVLNTVVSGGAVSTAELNDLQTIANNLNSGLATSDDVASEFIQLVDGASVDSNLSNGGAGYGNEANSYWTGGSSASTTLGDLQAGTTSSQLTKLLEKWFDGADMPDPTISGSNETVLYQAFSLPLYGPSSYPVISDIAQGDAGDCELCASTIEVTQNDPAAIESMIVEEATGVYGVRFYVDGNEMWVTVNDKLPVYTGGEGGGLVYMNEDNTSNPLWPDLIEKAYAELSATGLIGHPSANSYTNIWADYASDVLTDLTNCTSVNYYGSPDSPNYSNTTTDWNEYDKTLFIQAIAAGDDVILESYGNTYSGGKQELVSDHAFAMIGYDSTTGDFIVRNPWGVETDTQNYTTQFEVSMSDINTVEGDVVIANTARNDVEILTALEGWQNGVTFSDPDYVVPGQPVSVGALFSVIDTAGLPITEYLIQLVGSGTIDLNGATNLANSSQTADGEIVVSAADLSKLTYVPGSYDASAAQGNANVVVQAYDGTTWSPLTEISLTIGSQAVGVTPAINVVVAPSQQIAADKLFGGIGPVTGYDVTQVSAGSFSNNNFSSSQLSNVTYTAPSTPGVVTIGVYDYDNSGDGSFTQNVQILVGTSVASAIQNYDNGELSGAQAIADSAANVFANLDGLQTMVAAGILQGIKLTDGTEPTETITSTQDTADAGVLSLLVGQVNLEVTTDILIWASGVSGDFAVAGNWSNDAVPGSGNDVEISPSGTYTVSSSENETIASLTTAAGATLDITSGTFTITSGTGSGVNSGTMIAGSGATLALGGNVTNSGAIEAQLGGTIEISGAVSGPGSLTASSAGTIELLGSATASGLTIESGGVLEIGLGKVLSGFTVSGGAIVEAAAGGVVSKTTISSGGSLAVLSGGTASNMTVRDGGTMSVSSGGFADPTTIFSGGSEIVSAGGTDDSAQISGGVQNVFGSASSATAFAGGTQVVEAGGTASGTVISSGGTLDILSGGTAPGAVIKTGGIQEIGSGSTAGPEIISGTFEVGSAATASAVTVGSGGELIVEFGGTDLGAIVSSGGAAVLSSGGIDNGTKILKGGSETILSGGTGSGIAVSSGGKLIVEFGGSDVNAMVSSGATAIVSSGGLDSGATIVKGGTEIASAGGTAISTIVSTGGTLDVLSGGLADSATIYVSGSEIVSAHGTDTGPEIRGGTQLDYGLASGATITTGAQAVESGGVASDTILSGGSEIVSAHGSAIAAQISGGTQLDYGLASSAVVFSGAQVVESGGIASSTTVSGGTETISAHGTDLAARISGTQLVYGSASGAVVFSDAQVVETGGVASGTTLSGGTEIVSAHGSAIAAQISGGTQLVYGLTSDATITSGAQQVKSGGTASSTIDSGGSETISAGGKDFTAHISGGTQLDYGSASAATITSGTQVVESGGAASGTTVTSSGTEIVSAFGTDDGAKISGGTQLDYGLASGATISSGGTQLVKSGGTAISTKVVGGLQIVSGTASITTVSSGGSEVVSGGVAISTTILNSGTAIVSSGGTASSTTVSSGGMLNVLSGGLADPTKILSHGTEVVSASGTDKGAQISGGTQLDSGLASGAIIFAGGTQVAESGGIASVTVISSGGILDLLSGGSTPGAVVKARGILEIGSGGSASDIAVSSGGTEIVSSGGTAVSAAVLNGGKLIVVFSGSDVSATLSSGGTELVSSGGIASGATILKGGTELVSSGGSALDTVVNNGAIVNVSSGGLLTLSAGTIGSGATVVALSSGTVTVSGTVSNSATLLASGAGSLIDIATGAVVSGAAVEIGNGVVDVLSGGSANITFVTNDSGGLVIADSAGQASAFTGTVSGLGGATHTNHNQYIDLTGVTSAGTISVSYTSNSGNKSGTLDVLSNSTLVAAIQMIGTYSSGDFKVTAGQGNTVEITDPTVVTLGGAVQSGNATLFGNYIAGSFVIAAGGAGGSPATPTSDSQPPLLTHPHA